MNITNIDDMKHGGRYRVVLEGEIEINEGDRARGLFVIGRVGFPYFPNVVSLRSSHVKSVEEIEPPGPEMPAKGTVLCLSLKKGKGHPFPNWGGTSRLHCVVVQIREAFGPVLRPWNVVTGSHCSWETIIEHYDIDFQR